MGFVSRCCGFCFIICFFLVLSMGDVLIVCGGKFMYL